MIKFSVTEALVTFIVVTIAILLISFLLSYPLMLLWNGCLVPAVSNLNEVSWLQMWGIGALIGMLFKTTVTSKD